MILQNQSVLDLSIQEFGNLEGVMALAIASDYSITQNLIPGTDYTVSDFETETPDIQRYYKNRDLRPATALQDFIYNTLFAEGLFANGLFD
ncbi:hypothetical protein Peternella1_52 [Winogradskyella phage Peternella_1]|uniref:Uncharacterized protein n=1 Tax=Winogradskyella phage Peternella_1 TaxID=2745699 RepID=A0A8E4ZDM6_9CAUD|nr:hypothetical protein M1M32_gp52 [Winogradskyella phage Peternella_1]QQV91588.1 hypothetical protein Peternella1_52 [Winogradskyella phage Peternella_1]